MALDISHLNTTQKQAVTHDSGPVLLLAGAGTGKTTVITNRIAWLIAEKKAEPEEILAVTFTEKAAAEMEERVDRLLPLGYTDLWIHTFHAFCQRVLQEHALDIGLPNQFTVLDQTAIWLLIREHLDKFELDYYKPLGNPTRFIHELVNHFSRCKDEGVYPEDYLKYAEELKLNTDQAGDRENVESEAARIHEVAHAYHIYQQLLLENGALDFGDLINFTVKLFEKRPVILNAYQKKFKYFLVDEFQDTNWMQYVLIKLLAAPQNNIMVVGDDDQSIYKFRGASFSNILTFRKEFKQAKTIYLTDNYRSGQTILDSAYQFIQLNNPDRLEVKLKSGKTKLSKELTSHTKEKGEISVFKFDTVDDEVRGVIETIGELKESYSDFSWSDVAILVRSNEEAQRFVRYFRSMNVPHQFMAAKGLYSQDVIIAILSYLKLLDNYHESEALYHILTLPMWNIRDEDIVNLNHLASKKSWSLWHALHHHAGNAELSDDAAKKVNTIISHIKKHAELARALDPSVLIYRFLEDSGYLEYLTLEDTQYTREQLLYLNQFYKKVRTWEEEHLEGGVAQFIRYINLELESGDAGKLEHDIQEGPDNIKISTIHSAKGLEYRFVFIVGLVHLRFPTRERKDAIELPKALIKEELPEGDAHIQEERRLMYVAMTRAKEKLFLTFAQDYGGATQKKPSRFLEELGIDTDIDPSTVSGDLLPGSINKQELKKIQYTLPSKFSFTQIRTFSTCPKQYYYAHIIKIPAAGRATFSFGKVMHAVLQKFFELVQERSGQTQGDLFSQTKAKKKLSPVSQKELIELYDQLWEEDWFYDADNKKKYYEHGKDLLKTFYTELGDDIPVPVALEQPFNVKFDDITFRGVIDRVDEVEKKWVLIDYKTGKPPKDGKLSFKDKEQLLVYQMAAETVFKKEVAGLKLYFLESNEQYEFLGTDKELDKLRESIMKTVAAINESDFQPTPGFWCKSCDYRFICPAAQR